MRAQFWKRNIANILRGRDAGITCIIYFAGYHDDVIGTYGGIVEMPATEHRQLHRKLLKNGDEKRLIDYWITKLAGADRYLNIY